MGVLESQGAREGEVAVALGGPRKSVILRYCLSGPLVAHDIGCRLILK